MQRSLVCNGICTNGVYNCKQAFYNPHSTSPPPLHRHTVRRLPAKGGSTGFRRHSSEKVCRFTIIRQKKCEVLPIIPQKKCVVSRLFVRKSVKFCRLFVRKSVWFHDYSSEKVCENSGRKTEHCTYICPASTCLTMRSVSRSTPSASYFFVRLAPKRAAKAW